MKAPALTLRAPGLPRDSLVGRLVGLAAVWCLAVLLLTALALAAFFDHAAISRFDDELAADADDLYAGASVGPDGAVFAPVITDVRATRAYSGKYWQIGERRADGRVHALPEARSRSLWDSEDLAAPERDLAQLAQRPRGHVAWDGAGPHGQRLRVVAMERTLPGHTGPLVFMTAEDRSSIDADVRRFAVTTAAFLVVLGAGLVAAVILQVRVGLRPLFAMGRDVKRVRQGAAERLTGAYPAELSPLASELNALLDHNQDVVERQRTHVGNLAHALKTPISVMLTEAGAREEPLAELVRRQSSLMRSQVEHHLRRARAAARMPGSGERTPVAPVLDELVRTLDRIYGRRGVDFDWDAAADLAFLGERQDLLEMAGNLLENAAKYGRSEVRVFATAANANALRLVIEDDGPGLAPHEREAALQRGRRLDESAPGSGLGLSIVDDLARAYGGALALGASDLGGLKAELTLPRASDLVGIAKA